LFPLTSTLRHLILAALLTILFAVSGNAQRANTDSPEGRLKGLSLAELGNIEVTTTSKGPVKLSQTPAAVYVITREDIRSAGVTSIPEALRLAPGVEVGQIDSVKWAVGIRGFQSRLSRALLVLVDGRTVYSPQFHGVYWEVQDTLLEDIDRIEVIRGPGGTIWGANAVDGVINIITRNAKDTKGTFVSGSGGSVDQGELDVRQGGGNSEFSYRVYAKGVDHGPEYHSDRNNFDDWRRAQGGFRTDWNVGSRDTLTVQGDIYDSEAGERVRVSSLAPPSAKNIDQDAELSGGNVLARWQRTFANGSDLQLQGYYDRVNRLQANQAEYRNTFDLDLVHHFSLSRTQDFIWGVGARISPASLPAVIPVYVFTPEKRTDQLYSAYAQDAISLVSEKLALTLGAKLLHSSFSGFDVEPSARLLWTPAPTRTFWAAVTRAVRTPSDLEETLENTSLIPGATSAFIRTYGNPNFKSEMLVGYEAGYRSLVTSTFSVDLAAFYNEYNRLASLEPGGPFTESDQGTTVTIYPYTSGNGIKGATAGFELAADWKPKPWSRLQGSYSLLHMDFHRASGSSDSMTETANERQTPQHQARVQSSFDLSRDVDLTLTFRYVGPVPFYAVPGYATGDARIAWRPVRHIEFSVTGQNLLQPHHPEYGGDPGPLVGIRRSVLGSLTFRR
jgi:iron complex outermembrane receptor protein